MITSLFQYADFFRDKDLNQGKNFDAPLIPYLEKAALSLTEGYSSLAEAKEEDLNRFDGWGNEIAAHVYAEAAKFIMTEAQRI